MWIIQTFCSVVLNTVMTIISPVFMQEDTAKLGDDPSFTMVEIEII